MFYLTRLRVPAGHALATDAYKMHQLLERVFVNSPRQRTLFRIENPWNAETAILIQTPQVPNWLDKNLREHLEGVEVDDVKEVRPVYQAGHRLLFRLAANPTRERVRPDGKHVEESLREDADRKAWLQRKLEAGGATLESLALLEAPYQVAIAKGTGRQQPRFWASRFEGVLVITDPQKFEEMQLQGLGNRKAFGFGMLSTRFC